MNYIVWVVIALVGYTFVPPLMNLATQEIPSDVATFGVAAMLATTAFGLSALAREPVVDHLTGPSAVYVLGAGVCITVSILAFFRALSLGPVSVVVPVFGLFLVTSSLVGVALLGEPLTVNRAVGIGLAMLAIVVISLD
ncbi:EamA family transporter [Halorarius halobius]|uniref:EamA family transporter n=1 Tax=Halorarius halobius TaxID=2962671 RepID=UPI0020CFE6E4|nr:EamA family transporter [Halorarius halobius]